MAENVNEAGANHQTIGIHHLGRRFRVYEARRGDVEHTAAGQRHVAVAPGIAGAVHDTRPADENVYPRARHDAASFI